MAMMEPLQPHPGIDEETGAADLGAGAPPVAGSADPGARHPSPAPGDVPDRGDPPSTEAEDAFAERMEAERETAPRFVTPEPGTAARPRVDP